MSRSEKIAVLIDGANLFSMSQSLGLRIDYRLLRQHFGQQGRLSSLKFYIVVDQDNNDNPIIKLLDWLEYNGYRILRKPAHIIAHDDGSRAVRGSVIAEMAADIVLMAQQVDHIILIGGRPDHVYPVEHARRLGAHVTLIGTLNGSGFKSNNGLRRIVDEFLDLDDLQSLIAKPYETRDAAD